MRLYFMVSKQTEISAWSGGVIGSPIGKGYGDCSETEGAEILRVFVLQSCLRRCLGGVACM